MHSYDNISRRLKSASTKFAPDVNHLRLADKQSARPSGSLPSNTQPNPRGSSSKPYQPPQARNEQVNAISTRSGKAYDALPNLNNSQPPIKFESDDKEPTPQVQTLIKETKETHVLKPYKPRISYLQHLRKENMEAQYGKFFYVIRVVRINVPLVNVLSGMPNYDKFFKELVSNKHKLEQISSAFLNDECSAIIQNKVSPKLGEPGSFLIPYTFSKIFSCNALADIGAMPYSLYEKLSLETLKPTKISVRLADRSFQYPVRIVKNMLIEVGKFTFPVDFVILTMEEDNKVPLILGRPFLYTTDTVIRVKQKQLNHGVGSEHIIFSIDSTMKHSYSNDDICFSIDVIDEILE
ncbi:reverse transcriptase domain-containing protein [Tanacetum coccineum]|uniref:Reverse transcriptase domain-containing protein n=1 Tax=Tanacetum coccineum TaxID=301880 RepID=A0ABQ4Z7A6_9ASTR